MTEAKPESLEEQTPFQFFKKNIFPTILLTFFQKLGRLGDPLLLYVLWHTLEK